MVFLMEKLNPPFRLLPRSLFNSMQDSAALPSVMLAVVPTEE